MPEIQTVQTNHDQNGGEFLSLPLLYCHQRQAKPYIRAVRGGDRSGHDHDTINKHKRDRTMNMPTLKHFIRLFLIATLSLGVILITSLGITMSPASAQDSKPTVVLARCIKCLSRNMVLELMVIALVKGIILSRLEDSPVTVPGQSTFR